MKEEENDVNPQHRRTVLRTWPRARLVAALGLLAAFTLATSDGPRLEFVAGSVEIASGSPPVWRAAAAGDPVGPGDAIRTGHDGRAELVLGTGTVRLYANSMLTLPRLDGGDGASERVRLERGRSLFDVLKRRNGRFEVETPEVVVSVKGTRFGVDVSDALARVAVFRGLVGVRGLAQTLAMETLVREGFAAAGGAGRPFELILNGAPDPWDGWSAGRIEPMLENRALPRGSAASDVPTALRDAQPPARLAVAEARTAARDATRAEVIEIALQRDPELRERVAASLDRKRLRRAQQLGPEAIDAERMPAGGTPADPTQGRDTVVDSRPFKREIQSSLIESMVTGLPSGPGGAGSTGSTFQIDFVSGSGGSGGDRVIVTAAGNTFTFFDDDVADLLAGGTSFPPALLSFLAAKGVSGAEIDAIVQQMSFLLEGR
jgi:ferric-dicitrate binding protein FerR (iron transport regulator)